MNRIKTPVVNTIKLGCNIEAVTRIIGKSKKIINELNTEFIPKLIAEFGIVFIEQNIRQLANNDFSFFVDFLAKTFQNDIDNCNNIFLKKQYVQTKQIAVNSLCEFLSLYTDKIKFVNQFITINDNSIVFIDNYYEFIKEQNTEYLSTAKSIEFYNQLQKVRTEFEKLQNLIEIKNPTGYQTLLLSIGKPIDSLNWGTIQCLLK